MSKDEQKFIREFELSKEAIEKAGISVAELHQIAVAHQNQQQSLEQVAQDTADRLMQFKPQVHSVKYRVKDTAHLLEKILRKRIDNPNRKITYENYSKEITDLVGVRVLHLFKEEWEEIHEKISGTWNFLEQSEDHPNPVAYIREGDSADFQKRFEDLGCKVRKHKFGYRSVHYVIRTSPTKAEHLVEIQVRTIFEEGWSEIDHRVRYPRGAEQELLEPFLQIFNRLAGYADEMGAYVRKLEVGLQKRAADHDAQVKSLKETVEKLKVSVAEKEQLKKQVEELRATDPLGGLRLPSRLFVSQPSDSVESPFTHPNVLHFAKVATALFDKKIQCPKCNTDFKDPRPIYHLHMAGVTCPHCQHRFTPPV